MSAQKIKSVIKYLLSLVIGFGILWYLLRNFDFEKNREKFQNANYWWILLSVVLSWISHWLRGYRWKLLLNPLGYQLTSFRGFIAVMVGYLANLVFPRMGEVSRCAVLKKTDGIPMTTSIGSVVAERLLDLIILLLLIAAVLIFEFDIVYGFFSELIFGKIINLLSVKLVIGLITVLLATCIIAFILWKKFQTQILNSALIVKVKGLLKEVVVGFTSVLNIENKVGFWGSTVLIWLLYYLMSFVVVFSLDATQHLGLMAGLSILVAGGIGMSAPVQGGIGTYHALVIGLLALYGVADDDGKVFAIILHSSQTLSVIVIGLFSLLASIFIGKKSKQH